MILLLQYFYGYIETPVFVFNALYDSYQAFMIRGLFCLPPDCDDEKMQKFLATKDVSIILILKFHFSELFSSIKIHALNESVISVCACIWAFISEW